MGQYAQIRRCDRISCLPLCERVTNHPTRLVALGGFLLVIVISMELLVNNQQAKSKSPPPPPPELVHLDGENIHYMP